MRWMMLGVFVLLAACSGRPGPTDPLLSDRKLNIEEFFDGRTIAHGQFQDVFGEVRRRFVVDHRRRLGRAGADAGRELRLRGRIDRKPQVDPDQDRPRHVDGDRAWRARHGQRRGAGRYLQLALPHRPAGTRWHAARGVRRLDVAADRGPSAEHRLHARAGVRARAGHDLFRKGADRGAAAPDRSPIRPRGGSGRCGAPSARCP